MKLICGPIKMIDWLIDSELCGVFGIPRNGIFFHLINPASDTSTKREAAILKICPPAIITSPEVIIEEYDAILSQ